jgi:crossover junction endodeoxyribonuclease RuvC
MVTLLLGLDAVPRPHDAADALAVAICHLHQQGGRPPVLPDAAADRRSRPSSSPTSWRDYRPTSR